MVKSVAGQNVLGRNIKLDNIPSVFVELNALFHKTRNVLNVTDRCCPCFVLFEHSSILLNISQLTDLTRCIIIQLPLISSKNALKEQFLNLQK